VNAELRRNLWLEFGLHRRLVAPLVFGFFAAGSAPGEDWRAAVYPVAVTLAMLVLLVWGTRQASVAVLDEVRDRTWDLQRLSALGPWPMTWGKLAGSTVFPWYVGILCLAVVAATAPGAREAQSTGRLIVAIVAGAVALHGAALTSSLAAARQDPAGAHRSSTLALFGMLFVLVGIVSLMERAARGIPVRWYGWSLDQMTFIAGSALAFACWGVFGAWRAMCRELQVRTLPWAWPAFPVFVAAWLAGLAESGWFGGKRAFVAFGLAACVVATYVGLFTDLTTATVARRVLVRARAGQWRRALEELPVWPASLALAFVFALAAPWLYRSVGEEVAARAWTDLPRIAAHAPLALVFLAARDCAILAFFAFAPRPRRVEAVTLLYIFLFSWLVPGVLAAMGLDDVAWLLMPLESVGRPAAAIVLGAQAAIAWAVVAWRWRRHHG
jgi:hypothetical protein